MTWLTIILGIVLFVIINEAILWCYTINRHAEWLNRHPKDDRRQTNHKRLFFASGACGAITFLQLILWIYMMVFNYICMTNFPMYLLFYTLTLGQLMVIISFLGLIAKYSRLPQQYRPILTSKVKKLWKYWMNRR